jgi:hypothetical protein
MDILGKMCGGILSISVETDLVNPSLMCDRSTAMYFTNHSYILTILCFILLYLLVDIYSLRIKTVQLYFIFCNFC